MLLEQFFMAILLCINFACADDISIVGTWTTKSNQVFTGPGFYDPVDELLIEPGLPGRSYSFTEDGHYELALYIVTSNPKDHSCPTAVLQWEHGTYTKQSNGTIVLDAIRVDGRQLLSDPCNDDGVSTYSRYSSNTSFSLYYLNLDTYHGRYKLQLYLTDGSPLPPMWLAYKPPLMLPTSTLNPTDSSTATGSVSSKVKRSLENRRKTNAVRVESDYSQIWYLGIGIFSLGAISYAFL